MALILFGYFRRFQTIKPWLTTSRLPPHLKLQKELYTTVLVTPPPLDSANIAPKTVYLYVDKPGHFNDRVRYCGKDAIGNYFIGSFTPMNLNVECIRISLCYQVPHQLTVNELITINQHFTPDFSPVLPAVKKMPIVSWQIVEQACHQYATLKKQQRNPFRRQARLMKELSAQCKGKGNIELSALDKANIIHLLYAHQGATKVKSRAFAPVVALVNALYGISGVNDAFMYRDLMGHPDNLSLALQLHQDFSFVDDCAREHDDDMNLADGESYGSPLSLDSGPVESIVEEADSDSDYSSVDEDPIVTQLAVQTSPNTSNDDDEAYQYVSPDSAVLPQPTESHVVAIDAYSAASTINDDDSDSEHKYADFDRIKLAAASAPSVSSTSSVSRVASSTIAIVAHASLHRGPLFSRSM